MFRSFGGRRAFETHIGNNRRNAAALKKPFLRLEACQGSFDDFHCGGGYIVFRPQGDDCTAAVKNVSNELESGGTHQAVGIDAKSDVVDSFAAVHGFRNHELLVFRPGKLRGQLKGRRVRRLRGSRPLEQFANHGVEHRHRGRFGLPLKGGEHRAKTIRRGEDQLREIRPRSLSNLRSKHILEFVRQLTQLVESASCGIAFQSVDGTTNPANDFLIRGTSFELQARFVEGLEDLIGALKEESAQLAATIVAGTTHVVTSFRW